MTEMNGNGFNLTGDMVTATYDKNNDQVIPGMSNFESGQHADEFRLEMGQNNKNVFSKTNSALNNLENYQVMNLQMLTYENSQYDSELILQQDQNINNADNKNIKSEIFNISPVYETNGLQSPIDICDMINKPEFLILPPKKDKNPAYVIAYDSPLGPVVTAKRKAPVRMKIKMAVSETCKIILRYDDLTSIDTPVNICNTHQNDMNIDVDPKPMFIVKGHNAVKYEQYKGHPCCRIDSEGEYIIQFLCWNSCDQNRSNKKNMNIYVIFCDNASGLYTEEKIILRVAENVKRDAGITPARVRKRSLNEEFPENQATKMIFINEESDNLSPLSPQPQEAPAMLCIQVDSQKHIDMYKLIAENLGHTLNIVPGVRLNDQNLSQDIEYLQ